MHRSDPNPEPVRPGPRARGSVRRAQGQARRRHGCRVQPVRRSRTHHCSGSGRERCHRLQVATRATRDEARARRAQGKAARATAHPCRCVRGRA
uniref:Uncharacterized protein n=1 Tax=uncultured marine virus TaxID=186617 RepID=A0A0F7L6A6_9VIRU|nr:hypothetical protein [uncultured marine virus]